jgi:hypothetical protein
MKTGRTLQELSAEIKRRQAGKHDLIASTSALRMSSHDTSLDPKTATVGMWVGEDRYGVTTHAHNQIADYFKIPKDYYKRMLAEAPELLARNVNEWISADKKGRRMVRTMFDNVRAFLSDGYRRLENEDLAEVALTALEDLKLDIMSCQITDRRLYIKAVDPAVTRELKARGAYFGDGSHTIIKMQTACPAITIANSEVGEGRLSVLGGYYNGWCSNLASFGERSLKKTHLGPRHELAAEDQLFELFTDETKKKTDEALWLQVRDTIKNIFNRQKFDDLIDKVEDTVNDRIEGNPVKVVTLAAKKFGATKEQETSVLNHLIEGGSLSRFGLHNAFTRMAQDVEDYDEATRFESVGGKIIELPRTEWATLAKAA